MKSSDQKTRILVVDDVTLNLKTIHAMLDSVGDYELHGVNHGEAVFEHLQSSPRLPDLILLDVHMPDIDGIEILAGIKSNPLWSAIPVILMTSTAGEVEEQCLAMGAADFILKPFHPGVLKIRIRNLLQLQAQQLRQSRSEKQTSQAGLQAMHAVADGMIEGIDAIVGHWDRFYKFFGSEPDICPPVMAEELPLLLKSLRSDTRRIVRLGEELADQD